MKETELTKQILDYLRTAGIVVWRQNTGARGHMRWGFPGCGDITGIMPDGRRLEIECKAEKGKPSPVQQAFRTLVETNNGIYILARDLCDVMPLVQEKERGKNGL